jgi:GNAT superfamily N-acetyltransferase
MQGIYLEVINLTSGNVSLALCCESHGGHWEGGIEERRKFLLCKLKMGEVRGKIAIEGGNGLGWIDYYPRADGWIRIGCIDIKKEHRRRGVGRALVSACLDDCRGSKGVIVTGTVWDHMPKRFFNKFGFVDTNEKADVSLMTITFADERPPEAEEEQELQKYIPKLVAGKVVIDMFDDGECPTLFVSRQLVKEAAKDFGDKVAIREYDTKDKAVAEEFGKVEGIFLDGEKTFIGYPGELNKVKKILSKKLEAKGWSTTHELDKGPT